MHVSGLKVSYAIVEVVNATYGTHHLQLKRATSDPNELHTHIFVTHKQLHALSITFVYRATLVFTIPLHKGGIILHVHTLVLLVILVITTYTFIDSPQLDQVTRAVTYKCFDYKRGL